MFRQHQNQFDTSQDIKQLNDISEITIKPIPIYNFTNNYVPIQVTGVNLGEGIGNIVSEVTDVG